MPTAEPPESRIEVLPPDDKCPPPERRRASAFRPYSHLDGRAPDAPVAPNDRRRRRRAATQEARGRRLDLEG
jgi:hypothetical protein